MYVLYMYVRMYVIHVRVYVRMHVCMCIYNTCMYVCMHIPSSLIAFEHQVVKNGDR